MGQRSSYFVVGVFVSLAPVQVAAHSYGPAPRRTGAPGDDARACTVCHSSSALNSGTGSVEILLQSGPVYIPGVKQRVTVKVADPVQQRWGFELAARLNSDLANGQAGDLTPVDNFTQVICEDTGPKPCSSGPQFIEHTSAGTRNGTKGGAIFQFDWTPPPSNAGPVTLYVAGNAANGDGTSGGDLIYTSSVQLNPAIPVAPSLTGGNIVSAATSAAGPMAPNSWVTVYGSNLSVTTRAWSDGDFLNGGLPFSLDGVSVILTGAPRLAYVGYVSPTQVNFLLPSNLTPGTVQVQVRNPAGISSQMPITVQANAPQLFTADGKYVLAAHLNGSFVGKGGISPPAAPGETVILFGTGLGSTNPALIPGQIPAQPASLTGTQQVTIGGAAATVVSAGIVPGSAGLYQLNVQVPATAADGDQPVVCSNGGGVTSVTTLITVQK
jgi:uncharacterized protein (TIGR03437 family)